MKAKEYFEKYNDAIVVEWNQGLSDTIKILVSDLAVEIQNLWKSRNTSSKSATIAVIMETNQKWNAICRLFEKKYGRSPLKPNAFKEIYSGFVD